ncbi:MAG: phosphotransferase [Verrucomicrobia subdivision 3 bacterium]|nr:phosphotransferase [Limisphaerales bacterium]
MHAPVDREESMAWLGALRARGYSAEQPPFLTGRPDNCTVVARTRTGVQVVAKLCPGRGERAFANMQRVWKSSFGERRASPGLPQPLDYLPEPGVLITEYISGRPLAEGTTFSLTEGRRAIELLAALHNSDAQPESRRSSRGIVRSAHRKAERIAQLAPQFADAARAVTAAIEAARVSDSELCPSHGDFSPRNVLVSADRFTLIDWDRFRFADPARDVAYFGISTWLARIRRGGLPDRALLDQAVDVYEAARPAAHVRRQLRFHIAAGLLRIACSLVELWPTDAYLVPALMTVASNELAAK